MGTRGGSLNAQPTRLSSQKSIAIYRNKHKLSVIGVEPAPVKAVASALESQPRPIQTSVLVKIFQSRRSASKPAQPSGLATRLSRCIIKIENVLLLFPSDIPPVGANVIRNAGGGRIVCVSDAHLHAEVPRVGFPRHFEKRFP